VNAAVFRNILSKSGHTLSATPETDSRPPFRIAVAALLRITSLTASNPPERRDKNWPPENSLIEWRSPAGCGIQFCQPCVCSDTWGV